MISTYPSIECAIASYTQYLTEVLRKWRTGIYLAAHIALAEAWLADIFYLQGARGLGASPPLGRPAHRNQA